MMFLRLCALTVLVLTGAGAIVTEVDRPVMIDATLSPADLPDPGTPVLTAFDAG